MEESLHRFPSLDAPAFGIINEVVVLQGRMRRQFCPVYFGEGKVIFKYLPKQCKFVFVFKRGGIDRNRRFFQ